ncbi:MAG: hypothetical protein ABJE47_20000 [bacterium]
MHPVPDRARYQWPALLCVWLLIATLAWLDARAEQDYVSLLDQSGTIAADSLPLQRPAPADYADAQTWTRFALAIDDGTALRLRSTDIDNAPTGRDVHWNSALSIALAQAGKLRHALTGEALPLATERALAWINLPLFLLVVIGLSWWAARRIGATAGVLLALGMLGNRWFYGGFAPNYVDHHGLLSAASLGIALGAICMGAGWSGSGTERDADLLPPSPHLARRGALCSAVAGGLGMWISAASVIPTIAFIGIAAVVVTVLLGPAAREDGAQFDGDVWRLWSRAGALISVVAYLIEYAPSHLGWRLEVNHPLYALAWLGGGELIALVGEWRINGARPSRMRMAMAIGAVLAAPVVIAAAGPRVMLLLDTRMAALHQTIAEFQSIVAVGRAGGFSALLPYAIGFALLLPALALAGARPRDRILIAFIALVSGLAALLACWQERWWLDASGPGLCLLALGVTALIAGRKPVLRWSIVGAISALFVAQAVARIRLTHANVEAGAVTEADATQPLYRDVAAAIRQTQPRGDVVLLASPTASSGVGYFGRFKTLGTLYWENIDGLAAAASIFSARGDDAARALMQQRGVTHIALIGRDDYLREYLHFAEPDGNASEFSNTFGARLASSAVAPSWLREIGFVGRGDQTPALAVRLWQVVPEQRAFDAQWSAAAARAAAQQPALAERIFREAIMSSPAAQHATLFDEAGRVAFRVHAHQLALRMFDSAMALQPATATRVAAAWIQATSSDDRARNGAAALAAIQPLVQGSPNDPALLDVFAAALAEAGRFAEAVSVAERMIALVQARGDAAGEARAREHLASYRAGRAWRV